MMERARGGRSMVRETLHIATYGPDDSDAILTGIRYLPISKLILIAPEGVGERASAFAGEMRRALKIETEVHEVSKPILYNSLMLFRDILARAGDYEDVIVNASSGDKALGCAALTAAFINGLKTIVIENGKPVLLPLIKLSYSEIVSETKINILRAIRDAGGEIEELQRLSELTGLGKSLLSYHINGSEDSKGLIQLGLVSVSKTKKGKSTVSLTEMGEMLLAGVFG